MYYFWGINEELTLKWRNQIERSEALTYIILQSPFLGVREPDADLAFTWFKKAAEQDCSEAQYLLARCYYDGIGIEQNDELAFEWFRKAAEQGFADAQYWLACCYHKGKGVEQNDELALAWVTKAVQQTDAHICLNKYGRDYSKRVVEAYLLLGEIYAQGKGVEQSDETAFKWYEKATEIDIADVPNAQYRLALCYFEGRGVEKNYGLGMKWMIRAARKNLEEANNWISNAYLSLAIPSCILNKNDVEQYYKFAANLCLKEVDGHNAAEAYLFLGILYYSGKGIEQSDERALECLEKALHACYNYERTSKYEPNIFNFISLYLQNCNAQGKGVVRYDPYPHAKYDSYSLDLQLLGQVFVEGIIAMPFILNENHKIFLTLLRISVFKKAGEYELAKEFTKEVFDKTEGMDKNFKEICLTGIEQEQEIAEKNKALESEIKQKEALYKKLHEKEKEMLSFFTHTMRNALATAPESLRQAIHLLGSEVYEKDTKHYQAINKIAALFSTLSLTDCLIDTFKQSISDPQEFKQSWQKDHTGEATPKWVIASALRQSLNRIIFMSDTSELRKLLDNPETALIKATRKSFIEEVLPLNVDSQGVDVFYAWTHKHISAIDVSIADCDTLNFGVNQIRFSLLFAITSELILNALKYWDGENRIQISWQLTEQGNYVFSVKNHCKANATSNLAGTHKGLAFINRLVELLGEQARFVCKSEDQLFITELILNKALFNGES